MDARMQKHRMMRWIGRLLAVFSLVASCGAQALGWCPNPYAYGNSLMALGRSLGPYPTDIAALQAGVDAYLYGSDHKTTVVSCNGQGVCTTCFNWTSTCNNNAKFYDGIETYRNIYSGGSLIVPCGCPVAFDPAVPYSWNPVTGACVSPLTITLEGGTTTEPGTILPFIATVKNESDGQPPTNPVEVRISLKVEPKSGGHDHGDSTRPRGGIADVETCASDSKCWKNPTVNGAVVFNFNAPEASGTYTISATCEGCTNNPQTTEVKVKVNGLKPIPPSGLYALYETDGSVIGAVKNRHESNHYLTPTAANKLLVIAINYHHLYPKDPVLHINDASLMWGGLFDRDADWDTPHEEHRRGSVVDIRANSKVGAIPAANFQSFIQSAKDRGVDARIHNPGETSQHFHVRLLNRSE